MSEDLISREKAYEVLSDYYHHTTELQHKVLRVALDMVPSATQTNAPNTLNALDCISRQAAIATAISGRVRTLPTTEDGEDWIRVSEVRESLQTVPSAQPEIIRCKDCKHWGIHKWLKVPWCREMHIDRGAEDFCSNAERREDE